MNIRGLRRFGIASAVGGALAFVVLLCLGVALVRSIKPLSQLTAEAGIAATQPVPSYTTGVPAPTVTATLLLPTDLPTVATATGTPLPTDTAVPSPTPTNTPAPTEMPSPTWPVPPPPSTSPIPATDTPTPSPTPTDTPTPSPTPMSLEVRGSTAHEEDDGDLHVVGEVVNSSGGSIWKVKVVGTFYDTADQVVDTGFTYTMLDIVGAGEAAPFDLILLDPPPTLDTYELQVDYAITGSTPLRLEVVSHTGSTSNGKYHVLGEVRNQNSFTVYSVRIVAAFYNDQDEVLRTILYYTPLETLSSGQKAPYDITLSDIPNDLDHYALIVEADRQ